MPLTIRPQTPADFAAIGAMESPVIGVPFAAEEVARQAENAGPNFCALVAERDGKLIGRASAGFMPEHTPAGDMRCLVAILPEERGNSVGTALWEALQPLLAERRPNHLRANVDANDARSFAWAKHRGFGILHHHLFNQLDLAALDPGALQTHVAAAEARGFRFVPFAELRTPTNERRFHELYVACDRDTPDATDEDIPSWEEWRSWGLDAENSAPELWVVAIAPDGEWAGLTMPQRDGQDRAHIFMTGVARPYRGQGLSVAMKAAAALGARARGLRVMTTLNHGSNQPILAANRRLGFAVVQSIYRMVKGCRWE